MWFDCNKIIEIKSDNNNIKYYVSTSWLDLLNDLIKELVIDTFINPDTKESSLVKSLYKLINKLWEYDKNFEYIFIIINWDNEQAYRLVNTNVELIDEFCAIWSWAYYADWLYLWNKDIELKEMFELVSTKDNWTCSDFDLIDLTKS